MKSRAQPDIFRKPRRSISAAACAYGLGVLKTAIAFRLACMGFDRGTVFEGLRRQHTFEFGEQTVR